MVLVRTDPDAIQVGEYFLYVRRIFDAGNSFDRTCRSRKFVLLDILDFFRCDANL